MYEYKNETRLAQENDEDAWNILIKGDDSKNRQMSMIYNMFFFFKQKTAYELLRSLVGWRCV